VWILSGVLDAVKEMQQVFADCFVRAQGQGKLALGAGEAARTLDESMAEPVEGLEGPGGRTLGHGAFAAGRGEHLQLAREVVGHHGAQGVELVAFQSAGWNHAESGILFGIAQHGLLGAASVVELDDGFRPLES